MRRGPWNHVVSATGHDPEECLVLAQADCGVCAHSFGTEEAKIAADAIVMDANFATITKAIQLARATPEHS